MAKITVSTLKGTELDGTSSADTITVGTAKDSTIKGEGGDDQITISSATNCTIIGNTAGQTGNVSIYVGSSSNSIIIGGFGNETLHVGSGNASMYGSQGNTTGFIPLFVFFTPDETFQSVVFTAPGTGFGNNTLISDTANVLMCGNSGSVLNNVAFQTSHVTDGGSQTLQFELFGGNFVFGNNTLLAGSGNDRINGAADTSAGFALAPNTTPGTTAIADGLGSQARAIFYTDDNTFNFGIQNINAGSGNNIVNGTVDVVAHEAADGVATATNGGHATSIFLTGGDLILGGGNHIVSGNGNDVIYGTGNNNFHMVEGGTAYADGPGSVATVLDKVGVDVHDHVTPDPVRDILSDNFISSGNGNDTIYGTHYQYYNEVDGGTATALNGGVATSTITVDGTIVDFGSNTIIGGSGNDYLVGNVLLTTLEVVAGTATGAGASATAEIKNFQQIMGDNHISTGSGTNWIVPEALVYELAYQDLGLTVSTVDGHIRIADSHNNSITWGNSLLDLGSGMDTVFDTVALTTDNKLVSEGFETINNFNLAKDVLTFVGTDLNTLLSHTTLTHNGNDSVINFDGGAGGAITLHNLNVTSLSQLHINVLPDAATLIPHFVHP